RDTSALLLDNSPAVITGVLFVVEGESAARAVEIRGVFPVVSNCRFYSVGISARSEVFSGMGGFDPLPDSVTGNSFTGFTYIRRGLPAGRTAFE
ncbi:MAG: hypothetical protein FWC65_03345, partial [Treponema sp.]|nr:hypothetical protein [Treponema sp.]